MRLGETDEEPVMLVELRRFVRLLQMVRTQSLDETIVARILRRYFNAAASQLWADALRENNLL